MNLYGIMQNKKQLRKNIAGQVCLTKKWSEKLLRTSKEIHPYYLNLPLILHYKKNWAEMSEDIDNIWLCHFFYFPW